MADLIPIYRDAEIAVAEVTSAALHHWSREPQFGMSFEEQQDVIYNTLLSFQESD